MPKSVVSVAGSATAASVDSPLTPPLLIDTPSAFGEMLAALARVPVLAVDTESDSLYRYFYRVCLIQISVPGADYLVDPLRLPDLTPLGRLFADETVEKVFHAAENDILALQRDFGFRFANLFDTMLAARILGWRRVSLAGLLADQFGVQLDKHTQLTDWGQRPLTADQLSYGRLDTHYLLPLRQRLIAELHTCRRWQEAQEAFAGLSRVTYVEKPFDPDGFWRKEGVRDLRPDELAVLRELYLWRDGQARILNRPPFKVLSDDTLFELSQQQPRRLTDLRLGQWQRGQFGQSLLDAVARGLAAPPPQPPARVYHGNGRPDPAAAARYDRLRTWRTERAAERGVESDVVLTNEALLIIARAAPRSLAALAELDVMGPWKLSEYGPALLRLLAEG